MNKKQFIYGRLVSYENFLAGGDEKTATFAELREQLNKLETDEEYIKFVRNLDILFNQEQDCSIEKRFCKKYNIPYKGRVSTHLTLEWNDMTSVYREVKSLEYDEKQRYFIINGKKRDDASLVYTKVIKFEWDDRICVVTDDKSATNVVKHYKELLVKIKKQDIEKDF